MGNNSLKKFVKPILPVLKGLGQIMLQENALTGLLFLAGIAYGSPTMGLAALLATICGTITARVLKYDVAETDKGLYGFSAALTGVALILFLKPQPIVWVFIVAGSVLAAIIQHFFIRKNIPVFTLPFVLVTWLILFVVKYSLPALMVEHPLVLIPSNQYLTFAIKGFGQVIFQGKVLSGLLFFIAVFINSPIAALYGLAGALFSGIVAQLLGVPVDDIAFGLFSFNAVLCAIVFAGNKLQDGLWVTISVFLSLMISILLVRYGIIQLTFPFVMATMVSLTVKKKLVIKSNP